MWALIFVTFVNSSPGVYSLESTKQPYVLSGHEECLAQRTDLRRVDPSGKWTAICVEINASNSK